MKKPAFIAVCICLVSLLYRVPCVAQCSQPVDSDRCKKPIVLEVVLTKTGPVYKLGGKTFNGYPLDEFGKEFGGCKAAPPIYAVVDSRLPTRYLLGAVIPKLQADSVRYFIRDRSGLVEISIVSWDAELPQTDKAPQPGEHK